jgi:hypothetical protein
MMPARLRIRGRNKTNHKTWIAYWPWEKSFALCILTGTKHLITHRAGYSEYNDRAEPVLDSWCEPEPAFTLIES